MTLFFFLTLSIVLSQTVDPNWKTEGFAYLEVMGSGEPMPVPTYHLGVPFMESDEQWYIYYYGTYNNQKGVLKMSCTDQNCNQFSGNPSVFTGFSLFPTYNTELAMNPPSGECEDVDLTLDNLEFTMTFLVDCCMFVYGQILKFTFNENNEVIFDKFSSIENCWSGIKDDLGDVVNHEVKDCNSCVTSEILGYLNVICGFPADDFIDDQTGRVIYNYNEEDDELITNSIALGECFKFENDNYAKILKIDTYYYLYEFEGNGCERYTEIRDITEDVDSEPVNLSGFGAYLMLTDNGCANRDKDDVPVINYLKINQCLNKQKTTISSDNKLTRTSYTDDQCTEGATTLFEYKCNDCTNGVYVDCDLSDGKIGVENADCKEDKFEERVPTDFSKCKCMDTYYRVNDDADCKKEVTCDASKFLKWTEDHTACQCMETYYRVNDEAECKKEATCDASKFEEFTEDHTACQCKKGYKKENNKCVEESGTVMTMILSILTILFFIF